MTGISERSVKELLEALTRLTVTIGEVEPVGVDAHVSTRQLYAVTAPLEGEVFGRAQHHRADSLASHVTSHVNALDLRAPSARVLKMLEDDDLAHADDLTVELGDKDLAALSTGLENG